MRAFALLLLLSFAANPGGNLEGQGRDLHRTIQALAEPFAQRGDFGGAFAIRTPEGSTNVAVGWADLAHGVPNTPDTRFGIGSVSKQFTAALILRMVEDRYFSLEDTVQAFLPDLAGQPITVHQLLAHRSGLARDPLSQEGQGKRHGRSELLNIIAGLPREFEPGERTSYSNSGYIVLALLAEQVSDEDFCPLLREKILQPLELRDTGCLSTSAVIPNLAEGYDPGPGTHRLRRSPLLEWSNLTGPGGLYSTVGDLVSWGQVMMDRTFLSGPSWEAFMADHGDGRGYGVAHYTRHGHAATGHDGVVNGYTAFLEIYPDDHTVVAYAGNIRAGAFELMEGAVIGLALGESVMAPEPPSDEDVPVPFTEAAGVVGIYELFPGFHLTITWEDERLLLTGTGGYPTVLSTLSDGGFFYRSMYAKVRFEGPEETRELVWTDRGGQEYRARRVASR